MVVVSVKNYIHKPNNDEYDYPNIPSSNKEREQSKHQDKF